MIGHLVDINIEEPQSILEQIRRASRSSMPNNVFEIFFIKKLPNFRIAPSALKENKIADAQDRLKEETISKSDEEPQCAIYINEVKRFFCGRR